MRRLLCLFPGIRVGCAQISFDKFGLGSLNFANLLANLFHSGDFGTGNESQKFLNIFRRRGAMYARRQRCLVV